MTTIPVANPDLSPGSGQSAGRPVAGSIAALGNFDGVHRGHKALLAEARAQAGLLGVATGVVTFEPHPRRFFRPDEPLFVLSPPDVRTDLLIAAGADAVRAIPFDSALAAMEPARFVDEVLIGRLRLGGVVVGEDFAFGKGRAGRFADLRALMAARGARAFAVPAVRDAGGEVISSSRVRAALSAGDIRLANVLLGHRWVVRGEVVHGDKRGRDLGFPTANMVLPPECGLRHGIYAVEALIDGCWRRGAASFGRRPTFDDGAPRLETFVFDFAGDLYGRRIDIAFVGWVRGEERFDSIDALVERMRIDCDIASHMA